MNPARLRETGRLRPWLWLYIVGPLFCYCATFSWLKPGKLFARGDIFPYIFLNPESWLNRVWFAWDTKIDLGGPVDLPKFIPLVAFSALAHRGFDAVQVQHFYYGLMMALQFAAMAFMTSTLFRGKPLVAFAAAGFYCFNVSMFQVLPFPMFMFFLAYTPLMLALLIKALGEERSDAALLCFIVLSPLSSFLFVNPPTYVLFVGAIAVVSVVLLFERGTPLRTRISRAALGAAGVLLVNLFWLIPSYGALFGAGHQQVSAQRDDTFLTFVSRRANILNVYWLMPYWAWDFKIYYPFKPAYDAAWTVACSFLAPILFFSSLLSRTLSRRLVLAFVTAGVGLILLTTGVAPPFGTIGYFLYEHVPFYWLYREPTTKFPLLLIIVMAPLVGWQCVALIQWLTQKVKLRVELMQAVAVILALVAICEPAYPMFTGQLEGARDYGGVKIVSNDVRIPAYWYDLSSYLAAQDPTARVLMLPNDDFYQMNYLWGLYASDVDVLGEILTNPFVLITDSSYQGYLTPSKHYSHFQDELYQTVHAGPPGSLMPFLAAQGIRYVVQRNDINSEIPAREVLDPDHVRHLIRLTPELRLAGKFGALDLYEVRESDYVPPLYLAPRGFDIGGSENDAGVLGVKAKHIKKIGYDQVNPTRILVHVTNAMAGDSLVWAESFSPKWNACVLEKGSTSSCEAPLLHTEAFGFENRWQLPTSGNYDILLQYTFQKQLYLGYWISGIALTLLSLMLFFRTFQFGAEPRVAGARLKEE